EYAAKGLWADRHRDRCACVDCLQTTAQTIGGAHSNSFDHTAAEVLLHLTYEPTTVQQLNLNCVIDFGHLPLGEAHRDHNTNDFGNFASCSSHYILRSGW